MRRAVFKGLLLATILMLGLASDRRSHPAALESERQHDERMWAMMRQMLADFGRSNQVAALDDAWKKTKTPQQWVLFGWDQAHEIPFTPTETVQQIARACRDAKTLNEALQLACAHPADTADIILGLLTWTSNGGAPSLQGRADLALHFIHAAAYECLFGMGRAVSVAKEYLDQSQGKPFDLDDLAAGFAGAEWVKQAQRHLRWRNAWATGEKNLDRNLPAFKYGTGLPSAEQLVKIQEEIAAQMVR
jgi:hypothetical protein